MHVNCCASPASLILLLQFQVNRLANLGLVGSKLVDVALLRRQLNQLLGALMEVRREVSQMKVEVGAHLLSVFNRVLQVLKLLADLGHGRRELHARLRAERLDHVHLLQVAVGYLRGSS